MVLSLTEPDLIETLKIGAVRRLKIDLTHEDSTLSDYAASIRQHHPTIRHLLIIADQFEELCLATKRLVVTSHNLTEGEAPHTDAGDTMTLKRLKWFTRP